MMLICCHSFALCRHIFVISYFMAGVHVWHRHETTACLGFRHKNRLTHTDVLSLFCSSSEMSQQTFVVDTGRVHLSCNRCQCIALAIVPILTLTCDLQSPASSAHGLYPCTSSGQWSVGSEDRVENKWMEVSALQNISKY